MTDQQHADLPLPADPFIPVKKGESGTGTEAVGSPSLQSVVAISRELAQITATAELSRLVVTVDQVRLEFERTANVVLTNPAPVAVSGTAAVPAGAVVPAEPMMVAEPVVLAESAAPGIELTAPLVGVFYHAPGPGKAPFVAVGDQVRAGQQVGIVEAMKMMNEIVADRTGVVTAIHVPDAEIVEFGQPLLTIEPS